MRYQEIKEEQNLFEVNMSPSSLDKLVQSIEAKAGIEYEMIVPDVGQSEYQEREPNYDEDERARSIDSVIRFYDDGDFNYGRDIERFKEKIYEDYHEWLDEYISEVWSKDEASLIGDGVHEEFYKEFKEEAKQEVIEQHPDFGKNNQELEELINERVSEKLAEKTQEIIDAGWKNSLYERIREQFDEDMRYDAGITTERQWMESAGLDYMSDFENKYEIQWPHWSDPDDEKDIGSVADELEAVLGMNINWSSDYHGAERDDESYVLEPDSSLSPNNNSDLGLELVSPPMPLKELFDDMIKIKKWADNRGVYTGKKNNTGLHINVSVGDMNREQVDYIKLAILLGDQHVLESFGRAANGYCKSAIEKIKNRITDDSSKVGSLLDKMRAGMDQLATSAIHAPYTDKYTSINMKTNYVEFRSAGGDWLQEDTAKLQNTVKRFVVALDASMKPDLYRKEYLKKLYKLLNVENNTNSLVGLYAQFVAGTITRDVLLTKWGKTSKATNSSEMVNGIDPNGNWGLFLGNAGRFAKWPSTNDLRRFSTQQAAESYLESLRADRNNLRSDITVREIESQQSNTIQQQQPAPSQQSVGSFTGNWLIKDEAGTVLYRFGGVGNSQRDANRIAHEWLMDAGSGVQRTGSVEVVPEMA